MKSYRNYFGDDEMFYVYPLIFMIGYNEEMNEALNVVAML